MSNDVYVVWLASDVERARIGGRESLLHGPRLGGPLSGGRMADELGEGCELVAAEEEAERELPASAPGPNSGELCEPCLGEMLEPRLL